MAFGRTFGKEGSSYEFHGVNMADLKKKCQQLQEDQGAMKKKVNPKVLTMIDRCAIPRLLPPRPLRH